MGKEWETETMKMLYEIIGVSKEGDRVRLTIRPSEAVKEKAGMTEIVSNPFKFIEDMKTDALRHGKPESISVPESYWKEHKWNIGDIINIGVEEV